MTGHCRYAYMHNCTCPTTILSIHQPPLCDELKVTRGYLINEKNLPQPRHVMSFQIEILSFAQGEVEWK